MKKFLLSVIALVGFYSANAQLNDGCKAENFTFTALNNNNEVCDLYTWLNAGYVVILDVSATWCGPCWSYKNTGALSTIYTQHGPSGTNKVRVLFVDGDPNTTDADMAGTGTNTQGNWVTGTNYPMCNPAAGAVTPFNANYEISYFPTIYMICPDRSVKEIGQMNASQINAQLGAVIPTNTQCAAKINVDATPTAVDGKLISCTGGYSFNLTLKNRGFNDLTSATINAKNGATVVATQPWSGNLTTYQSANLTMNIPNASGYDSLTIEVVAAGDQITANNSFTVYIDNYNAGNASSLPYTQNMDGGMAMPSKLGFEDVAAMSMFGFYDGITNTSPVLKGADGNSTKAVFVNFYNRPSGTTNILVLGNYNTNTASPYLYLDFNLAYAQYQAENDKLEILTSTDCGVTWTQRWTKSGTNMKTSAPTTSQFLPSTAAQWAYYTVDVSNIKNNPNAMIAVRATSDYGNYAWIDNLKLAGSSVAAGLNNVDEASLNIYPNPAVDAINIRGLYGNATISLIDVMGRTVISQQMENINNETSLNVNGLVSGKYFIKITQAGNTVTKPVVIAK